VDEAQTLAARFNVEGIPTLIFLGRNGTVAETTVGVLSAEALRKKLEALSDTDPADTGG
jgi:thiol:disulfide interchange protein